MTEERVLALAGLFQATSLTQQLASTGQCDAHALESSLASIFTIDAPTVPAVYQGVGGVRNGLRQLIDQLDGQPRQLNVVRMTVAVLRLERSLARRPAMMEQLQQGLLAIQRQSSHFGLGTPQLCNRLAQQYTETLSTLRPRVMISGDPPILQRPEVVAKIRACLLAAVRSAFLWRQLGGQQWQLIAYRRHACMIARGLLTGVTIENG
ncbi:high frequency lysogenization protein HflD [Frateuria aurantia]